MNYSSIYINDLAAVHNVCPSLGRIKGKRILVTGATGLICSAVVDFLLLMNETAKLNIKVYVAVRSIDKAKKRFLLWEKCSDIVFIEYNALTKIEWGFHIDYIIHGASPANPTLYVMQPVETMLANFVGLNNILEYSRTHSTNRVLFISSSEVYGQKDSSEPYKLSEYGYVDILNPRACYPSAKRACETLCSAYLTEYGVDSVIVRLGHIYGPTATRHDTRASSQFFYDVIDGHDIVMKSAGSQIRSYCYVADCVSAIMTVLLNGESGKAYNVSNPSSVATIRELAEEIAKSSCKKVVFEKPSDAEKKGYNLMDNSSLDASALLELGWYGKFDLKAGVEHTLSIILGQQDE